MASPPASKPGKLFQQMPIVRLHKLPLSLRRLGAWTVEVSLVAASAFVPWSLGESLRTTPNERLVPLNPVIATVQDQIAQTLGIPTSSLHDRVPPLTNLLWSGAIATPILLISWQLFLLGTTGKTTPKRWFQIKIIAGNTHPPGIIRILMRELIGRWGIPVGTAYVIWRYSGAFPDLSILIGLSGLMLILEVFSGLFDRHYRSLHDRLAGTYVLSEGKGKASIYPQAYTIAEDAETVTAIIAVDNPSLAPQGLWNWMLQHPGLTLLIAASSALAAILGTFAATQIYTQTQVNQREYQQQDNQLFLELVNQLQAETANLGGNSGRWEVILAIGTLDDTRAGGFLVNLLSQETDLIGIEVIEQAIVSSGLKTLPHLQRLNQSIRKDLETVAASSTPKRDLLERRLRATKQAIAKLLTLYSTPTTALQLPRVDLSQTTSPIPFTLVLDHADLAGIGLRGATLTQASLRGVRFYGVGLDQRWNTYDDAIADLSGADLKEANLTNANLTKVNLTRTSLLRATLNNATLNQATLNGANLSSAKLLNTSLETTILEQASLTGADLTAANLTRANLRKARLTQLKATGAQFPFSDLTQSDWQGADLTETNFTHATLTGANFNATLLVGANLSKTQLQNATFRGADLRRVSLQGANLTGTDFQGAIFAPIPPQPGTFLQRTPLGTHQGLQGVNFQSAKNLNPLQLQYICAQGGIHSQCRSR